MKEFINKKNLSMKKIFLDCGTHLTEGLRDFYSKGIINSEFEVHTFEANPACRILERIQVLSPYLTIIPHQKAVWIEDGHVFFNQENHKKSFSCSPTDGTSDIDGWGSSVDGIGFEHPGYEEKIKIESVDFSNFVRNLPDDALIICKMDIEGSEFPVLRKMIQEETIKKIKSIYIEFHERFMPNESSESRQEIINQIESFGVETNIW
jgi:FkbM family methyltransferase